MFIVTDQVSLIHYETPRINQLLFTYTIALKLSIFYTIPIFEVMKNNLSFGFYSTSTLAFWLPNLDKLVSFTTVHERVANDTVLSRS